LIKQILDRLRFEVAEKNKRLAAQEQIEFDTGDMFFALTFKSTDALREIAKKADP
jgi:hypothetical protein